MEMLYSTELAIPLYQVGLLLVLSTLALFFGRLKLALLVNYLFVLYWGFWLSRESVIGSAVVEMDQFSLAYIGFGIVICILTLIGFLHKTAE